MVARIGATKLDDMRDDDDVGDAMADGLGAFRVGDQDDLAAARRHFLHVGQRLFDQLVRWRDDDHRHRLVDQRDRAMLELACRITFGVDVADFLELQRAFHGDREHRPAAEIEHVLGLATGAWRCR